MLRKQKCKIRVALILLSVPYAAQAKMQNSCGTDFIVCDLCCASKNAKVMWD